MMEFPSPRSSNLDAAPLAGAWMYRDQPQDDWLPVRVDITDGATILVFHDDEGTQLHFDDLPDRENWKQHFRRTA